MEYIAVSFDGDTRDVIANGNPVGSTDDPVIMLPLAFYTITLSGDGYTPTSWNGDVAGTTVETPIQIAFAITAGASAAGV